MGKFVVESEVVVDTEIEVEAEVEVGLLSTMQMSGGPTSSTPRAGHVTW